MLEKITAPPNPAKIRRTSLLIGICVFIACSFLYWMNLELLNNMEGRLLDARFQLRGIQAPSGSVAIAAIDDKSLKAIGRWPWSRTIMAELIKNIHGAGASVIALDIVFAEPEDPQVINSLQHNLQLPDALISEISQALQQDSPDKRLSRAIKQAGNVIGGYYFYTDVQKPEREAVASLGLMRRDIIGNNAKVNAVKSKTDSIELTTAWGAVTNLPDYSQAFLSEGFFNVKPDSDGIVRYAPLLIRFHETIYPSLAVKAFAAVNGGVPIIVNAETFGISDIMIGDSQIKTDELGRIILNYRGPPKTIPRFSAVDILNHQLPPNAINNKIVIVGVPAIGIEDMRSTPFDPSFPGVEIQATVLENLLQQDAITQNNLVNLVDVSTMLGLILILSFLLPRLKGMALRSVAASLLLLIYLMINFGLFVEYRLWVNLVYPLLAWLLSYSLLSVYLGIAVERTLTNVRHAFKSYLHPGLVDQLVNQPTLLKFGGEQKNLSILFSDIRNFTQLSETLTPQQIAQFLRCYMDPMTEEVFKHRGTLDKYVGDAVMAIFGAPYPSDEHPHNACRCALDMIARLNDIKTCCPDLAHLFPLHIGVGIHTGNVAIGNFGSSYRFTYTVLGDAVNLTSRLESMTKLYGVSILISEDTYQQIKDQFNCREMDLVRAKGKEIPIRIYELLPDKIHESKRNALNIWQEALSIYHARHWDEALRLFNQYVQCAGSDTAAELYIDRIGHYQSCSPGEAWDGVYTSDIK